jgi:branched-chain amino acid transport system ATP-binding protein
VEELLRADRVKVELNGRKILRDITCYLERGEIMLVAGPNGSGKSSLLKCIMGLMEFKGRVFLDDVEITNLKPSERFKMGITLAPERLRVAKNLTVEENVSISGDFQEALEIFPELRPLAKKKAGKLSGGERQMVVLARAFISKPKYLLLDEPFQGLHKDLRVRVINLIYSLSKKCGVVVVTHDELDEIFLMSDKTCILVGGEVLYFGDSEGAEQLIREMFI